MTNKIAIVTGGSRGIGHQLVLKLGQMGYNIAINYRSDSSETITNDLAAQVQKEFGVQTLVVKADVSKYEEVKKLIDSTVGKFGDKIDVLINNAGITNNSNFIDIKPEDYENLINVNLLSVLHATHLALPYMVDHKEAANIISVASIGGMMPVVNQSDYSASKASVIGFDRSLALELAPRNVKVNTISPGMIMSDMLAGVNQDELKALAQTIPMGHIGDVKDISSTMEFLINNEYMTGQNISPNGGVVMD
ncbi:MAG: SDR family NAD(P)-dependent oxidoreductase [Lactobacillaceae bacterium]|jgi:3-oxoacyl-[acyl-carrier protein] reductase|nr:SDR family NAD(P)-dependent oxidoreductase [Lactobacillaceae bacterium]